MKQNLKLLLAIRDKGLRQKDFAILVEDDPAIISRIINGSFLVDKMRKIKYAKALGMKPEELFGE